MQNDEIRKALIPHRHKNKQLVASSKMELIVRPPSPLSDSGNIKENWKDWKMDFLVYLGVNCKNESEEKKMFFLKQYIGEFGIKIVNKIIENMINKNNITMLLTNLDEHFGVHSESHDVPENEVTNRYKFFTAERTTGSIAKYANHLQRLAAPCKFGEIKDSLIRDKIILEVKDGRLRKKLFKEENLDLPKLITIWNKHVAEASERKQDTFKEKKNNDDTKNTSTENNKNDIKTTPNNNVSRNKTVPKRNDNNNSDDDRESTTSSCSNTNWENNTQQFKRNCWRCNTKHPMKRCPAWGNKCEKCGEYRHFTNQCRLPFRNYDKRNVNEQNTSRNMHINESNFQHERQLPSAPQLDFIATGQTLYPVLPTTSSVHGPLPQPPVGYNQNQSHRTGTPGMIPNMPNAHAEWSWMHNENLKSREVLQNNAYAPDTISRSPTNNHSGPQGAGEAKNTKVKSKNECILQ
ncbi:uncharacterized protein DDB_G0287625-like isoform X2 [Ceratina calcarata]|uniref:Uncharacterized protein DDB_G0287625-like isoform X2 n=1 Tax=Ceratina calcarata TaxID=156304 RepID=A0AAJ7NDE7_9HYME|nr:uncharacterized protein DDB_G0287625-like isoform X2 [Ceratina calcarata]